MAAYGDVNTAFVCEFKRGFVKMDVSRAVRLRECPLGELPLYLFEKHFGGLIFGQFLGGLT